MICLHQIFGFFLILILIELSDMIVLLKQPSWVELPGLGCFIWDGRGFKSWTVYPKLAIWDIEFGGTGRHWVDSASHIQHWWKTVVVNLQRAMKISFCGNLMKLGIIPSKHCTVLLQKCCSTRKLENCFCSHWMCCASYMLCMNLIAYECL